MKTYTACEAKKLIEMGFLVKRDERYQNEYRYIIVRPRENAKESQ